LAVVMTDAADGTWVVSAAVPAAMLMAALSVVAARVSA
jgi:hypothetical protein